MAPHSKVYSYYDCIVGAENYHLGRAQSVVGIRKIGTDRIEIGLRYPFPPFLSVLAGATAKILPIRAATRTEFFVNPIGSGAFKLYGHEVGTRFKDTILKPFESYYGRKPMVSELVLRAMDEKEALSQAKAGTVHDLANFPLSGNEDVFAFGVDVAAPIAATWIIGLNSRISPFDNVKVRRAFRDSIDTEAFRQKFHADAIPSSGYIPPGLPGYQWPNPKRKVRSEVRRADITGKKIQIAIPAVLSRGVEIKKFIEDSLGSLGWNVEAVLMDWDALMRGYSSKNLQGFLVSMNMDYPDTEFLVRNFESTNPDNFSGLHDPTIDAVIHKARGTQDRVVRQELYGKLVGLLHEAAVTVDLFHPRGHHWVHSCVRGFEPNILADVYIDYRGVTIDPNCKLLARDGK